MSERPAIALLRDTQALIDFDPAAHVYRVEGRPVINVTRVLKPLISYEAVPPDILERARVQGINIHLMVELHAKGDLDESTLPEWLRPYFAAWLKFLAETGFRVYLSEHRVYNKPYGYVGTLDLFGYAEHARRHWLVDLKRSLYAGAAIGVQLSAYEAALQYDLPKELMAMDRFGLVLRKTGDYVLQPYPALELSEFLACLSLYKWRLRHGYVDPDAIPAA